MYFSANKRIHNYDINVVATYTYGTDGDLPDEIVDFYEELEERGFNRKNIWSAWFRDTFYDVLPISIRFLMHNLQKTGAKKGAENVLVDLNAEAEDIRTYPSCAKA